jgi:hypothetical protein
MGFVMTVILQWQDDRGAIDFDEHFNIGFCVMAWAMLYVGFAVRVTEPLFIAAYVTSKLLLVRY